jgi:lipoprotein-anchoring transpeptidase ErfK/SrfK
LKSPTDRIRPLVLLVALLATVSTTVACADSTSPLGQHRQPAGIVANKDPATRNRGPSRRSNGVVKSTQQLVALFHSQQARSGPTARSAPVDLVNATTSITRARTRLPVLDREGQWLKVRLPGRPNSHVGWISETGTTLSTTSWHIVVDLSRRSVTAYRGGRPVRTFPAVVGKPSTPTPTGEFFIEDSLALRASEVGAPYALALSARSDVFQRFAGGPGQIALHGLRNIGGVPGTAVSHGCLRLPNQAMRWLVFHVGIGTPVTIGG